MDRVEKFLDNFLAHYASQYYDPAKAHAYYLQNRQLKGRHSTAQLKTQAQKEGFAYVQSRINEAKKGDLTDAAAQRKALAEHAHEIATQKRAELSDKLSTLLATISAKHSEVSLTISSDRATALKQIADEHKKAIKQIADKATADIAALPPIPKGIKGDQRAMLVAQRKTEVDRIRGEAHANTQLLTSQSKDAHDAVSSDSADKRTALDAFTKGIRDSTRGTGVTDREAVSTELKATLDKARADYESLKENLKAEYDQKVQKEYDAIKKGV